MDAGGVRGGALGRGKVCQGVDLTLSVAEALRLLDDTEAYRAMSLAHNPYGDGKAAERIVAALKGCISTMVNR